jgi:protein-disulfide isomerase
LAAGKQNKMWYFIELFYHEQGQENSGYVTESYLQGLAEQVPGLNISEWGKARQAQALSGTFEEETISNKQAATRAGFTGTPSFLLGRTGGSLQKFAPPSLTEPGPLEREIRKLLKS